MAINIGGGISIGTGITITSVPDLTFYNLLSPTGQAAWSAAPDDGWFRVDGSDYVAVRSGLSSVTTFGNSGVEMSEAGGSRTNTANGATLSSTSADVDAGNYVFGLSIYNSLVPPGGSWTFRPYASATFKGTYFTLGSNACDTENQYGLLYFLRKKPSSTNPVRWYAAVGPAVTSTGFTGIGVINSSSDPNTGPARSPDMSTWTATINATSVAQQWLATSQRQW